MTDGTAAYKIECINTKLCTIITSLIIVNKIVVLNPSFSVIGLPALDNLTTFSAQWEAAMASSYTILQRMP